MIKKNKTKGDYFYAYIFSLNISVVLMYDMHIVCIGSEWDAGRFVKDGVADQVECLIWWLFFKDLIYNVNVRIEWRLVNLSRVTLAVGFVIYINKHLYIIYMYVYVWCMMYDMMLESKLLEIIIKTIRPKNKIK